MPQVGLAHAPLPPNGSEMEPFCNLGVYVMCKC